MRQPARAKLTQAAIAARAAAPRPRLPLRLGEPARDAVDLRDARVRGLEAEVSRLLVARAYRAPEAVAQARLLRQDGLEPPAVSTLPHQTSSPSGASATSYAYSPAVCKFSCVMARRTRYRPLDPKPPAPRAVSSSASTSTSSADANGVTTSCAMRSPGSTSKAASRSVFSSSTRTSPRYPAST